MQRQNVIVLIKKEHHKPIVRGNFKKLCIEFELPYHSLKAKEFPIYHDGNKIYKVEFK